MNNTEHISSEGVNTAGTARTLPNRRTVIKAAAWSVPVIAVAVSTPAAAASPAVCPIISNPAAWTESANAYANINQSNIGTVNGRTAIVVQSENLSARGSGRFSQIAWTTTMAVVAGTTYTFTFDALGNYGNYNAATSRPIYVEFAAAGASLGPALSTRVAQFGDTQLPIRANAGSPYVWGTYTYVWVAPATNPAVSVQFNFTIPDRIGAQTASDDITVTFPQVTCS